jgi:hypothetical protein
MYLESNRDDADTQTRSVRLDATACLGVARHVSKTVPNARQRTEYRKKRYRSVSIPAGIERVMVEVLTAGSEDTWKTLKRNA